MDQVLALLGSRYGIRWFAQQVQLPLESCLPLFVQTEQTSEAEPEPEVTLDLDPLWQELETRLQQGDLPPVQALEVATEGISQIVLHFTQFADLAFEELEAVAERGVILPIDARIRFPQGSSSCVAERGVILPIDAFNRYVRQTMEIDFDQFIQPLVSLPRKSLERNTLEGGSIVGELDRAAVLQVLDEQMS